MSYFDFRSGPAIKAMQINTSDDGLAAIIRLHENIHYELTKSTKLGIFQMFLRFLIDHIELSTKHRAMLNTHLSQTTEYSRITHESVAVYNSLLLNWEKYPSDAKMVLRYLDQEHLKAINTISPLFRLPLEEPSNIEYNATLSSALMAIAQETLSAVEFMFVGTLNETTNFLVLPNLEDYKPDLKFRQLIESIFESQLIEWVKSESEEIKKLIKTPINVKIDGLANSLQNSPLTLIDKELFSSFRTHVLNCPSSMDIYNQALNDYTNRLVYSWNNGIGKELCQTVESPFKITSKAKYDDISRFSSPFFEANENSEMTTPKYHNVDQVQMTAWLMEIKSKNLSILSTVMINPSKDPLPTNIKESNNPLPPKSLLILVMPFSFQKLCRADLPLLGCVFSFGDLHLINKLFSQVETIWRFHFIMHKLFKIQFNMEDSLVGNKIVLYQEPFPNSIPELIEKFNKVPRVNLYLIRAQVPNMFFVIFHIPQTSTFHVNACSLEQINDLKTNWLRPNIYPELPLERDMHWLTIVGTYTWIYGE